MLALLVLDDVVTQSLVPNHNTMLKGETENEWKRERERERERLHRVVT